MITSNKLIALIKKNNLPYHDNVGFRVQKYYGDVVRVTYSGGRYSKFLDEINNYVKLGNILSSLEIPFGFNVDERENIEFLFNSNRQSTIFSEEFFRRCTQSILDKAIEREQEEKNRKQAEQDKREYNHNAKTQIAWNLNPNLNVQVLENIDDEHFIGFAKLNTQESPMYIQFSAEYKSDWRDENKSWNLKTMSTSWRNGSFDGGGSSSVSNCETVEAGLIEYIVTWCIYLSQE
jgi:hypothetical protein